MLNKHRICISSGSNGEKSLSVMQASVSLVVKDFKDSTVAIHSGQWSILIYLTKPSPVVSYYFEEALVCVKACTASGLLGLSLTLTCSCGCTHLILCSVAA